MRKKVVLTEPAANDDGTILGSFFQGQALAAGVLTPEQIRAKHSLTLPDYQRIVEQVQQLTVLDALFRYPDGPRYDTLLWLVASTR